MISRLLSHYWTADEPVALRQAQAEDWLDDLGEFPPEIVAAACREWRRNETRRPLPAELRRLCNEEVAFRAPRLPRPAPLTREEAMARAEAHARHYGFTSLVDYLAAGQRVSIKDNAGGCWDFGGWGISHDRNNENCEPKPVDTGRRASVQELLEIRERILARAGNRCEGSPAFPDCRAGDGQPHPAIGTIASRVSLHVEYLDHDFANRADDNLRAWCQRCHVAMVFGGTHAHNTLSADRTDVQVFYPFHPLHGAALQILRRPKRGDGAVCIMDPAGRRLKIPIWMLSPECAEVKISQQPYLSKNALLSLASLITSQLDFKDRVHDNLLQARVSGCEEGRRGATSTSGPDDPKGMQCRADRCSDPRRSDRSHGPRSSSGLSRGGGKSQ